jgi:hypothetical protein
MADDLRVMDAQFWTDRLADYVRGAIERRESAAQRLITALGWFWTVYTASSLLGHRPGQRVVRRVESRARLVADRDPLGGVPRRLVGPSTRSPRVLQTESQAIDLWERVLARKLWRRRLASGLLILYRVLIVAGAAVVATRH